eukprot:sb/3473595/
MPRRSGFGSRPSPGPSRSPPRATSPPPQQARAAPPPQRAAAPAAAAPSAVAAPAAAAPQKGGMMRDIATTAAGVAGGHLAANAIMGMWNGSGSSNQGVGYSDRAPQQQGGPCGQQLQDFINCTQNNYDISLCTGFNQALKDCKLMHPGQ